MSEERSNYFNGGGSDRNNYSKDRGWEFLRDRNDSSNRRGGKYLISSRSDRNDYSNDLTPSYSVS